jgi:hypothetical protein
MYCVCGAWQLFVAGLLAVFSMSGTAVGAAGTGGGGTYQPGSDITCGTFGTCHVGFGGGGSATGSGCGHGCGGSDSNWLGGTGSGGRH